MLQGADTLLCCMALTRFLLQGADTLLCCMALTRFLLHGPDTFFCCMALTRFPPFVRIHRSTRILPPKSVSLTDSFDFGYPLSHITVGQLAHSSHRPTHSSIHSAFVSATAFVLVGCSSCMLGGFWLAFGW